MQAIDEKFHSLAKALIDGKTKGPTDIPDFMESYVEFMDEVIGELDKENDLLRQVDLLHALDAYSAAVGEKAKKAGELTEEDRTTLDFLYGPINNGLKEAFGVEIMKIYPFETEADNTNHEVNDSSNVAPHGMIYQTTKIGLTQNNNRIRVAKVNIGL